MRNLIIITCMGLLLVSAVIQKDWPDLSKKGGFEGTWHRQNS